MRVKMGASDLVELGKKCKSGQILRDGYRRAGYTRSDGTRVAAARVGPSCVPDKGAPGKTPAARKFMPAMGPSPLKGWHKDQAASTRHSKLRKLSEDLGCGRALKRVNVLANVTTDKVTENKLRSDYKWLRGQGFCRLKSK